jgi:DNA-binding transcriptional MerR regulator
MDLRKATDIPDKLYFKIGEVARLAGVEPYVLRYWETEFHEINPVKSRSKQRLYRRKDIETVLWIKQLLYEDGFTIDGARKKLRELKGEKVEVEEYTAEGQDQIPLAFENQPQKDEKFLKELKSGLEELLKIMTSFNDQKR